MGMKNFYIFCCDGVGCQKELPVRFTDFDSSKLRKALAEAGWYSNPKVGYTGSRSYCPECKDKYQQPVGGWTEGE